MKYIEALKIIEEEFETIKESSHNKIIITNLTYDGFNSFCVSIYDTGETVILTDLGTTKDVFDEVSEEEWIKLCNDNNFKFNHWSIVREFTSIQDGEDFIKFLDEISSKYGPY